MPDTEDKRPRCRQCDAQFHPNRWWQRYCSAYCCTEFHRRERQQMRQLWKAQQARVALIDELAQAHEVPAQAEPLRRRL
jgi:hypothetical protein